MHVNCNLIEKHCPVFFRPFVFRIREITNASEKERVDFIPADDALEKIFYSAEGMDSDDGS